MGEANKPILGKVVFLFFLFTAVFPVTRAGALELSAGAYGRVYGNYFTNQVFTGLDPTGTAAEDKFLIYQRFDLRFDFTASENLKFRYVMRVNDTPWGGENYTVDNPAVCLETYNAYLQFTWPGTDIQITAGYQDTDWPWSSIFGSSLVLGGTQTASAVIDAPLIEDTLTLQAAFARQLDLNPKYDDTTTQVPDEFDTLIVALPYTSDTLSVTPWVVGGMLGDGAFDDEVDYIRNQLLSAGYFLSDTGYHNGPAPVAWAGVAGEYKHPSKVNVYFDAVFGQTGMYQASRLQRRGWFLDAGLEYTGWEVLKPQLTGWYSPGEDSDLGNGSERFPYIVLGWGPGNSFLYNTTQTFDNGYINAQPAGSWGVCASLAEVSFLPKLTHTLSYTMQSGLNSSRAMREAVLLTGGSGNYVTMGNDLAYGEVINAINFDSYYEVFDNLTLAVETGWANLSGAQSSVWGSRLTHKVNDAVKVAFGLTWQY